MSNGPIVLFAAVVLGGCAAPMSAQAPFNPGAIVNTPTDIPVSESERASMVEMSGTVDDGCDSDAQQRALNSLRARAASAGLNGLAAVGYSYKGATVGFGSSTSCSSTMTITATVFKKDRGSRPTRERLTSGTVASTRGASDGVLRPAFPIR